MAITQITPPNLFKTPYVTQKTVIGDIEYIFTYSWNIRSELASLSIQKPDETYLIKSQPLKTNCALTSTVRDEDWTGLLMFFSVQNTDTRATIKNFNTDFLLIYDDLQD